MWPGMWCRRAQMPCGLFGCGMGSPDLEACNLSNTIVTSTWSPACGHHVPFTCHMGARQGLSMQSQHVG